MPFLAVFLWGGMSTHARKQTPTEKENKPHRAKEKPLLNSGNRSE